MSYLSKPFALITLICFPEKPTAAPEAKKVAVDGRLYFIQEPQSIKVIESKSISLKIHHHQYF